MTRTLLLGFLTPWTGLMALDLVQLVVGPTTIDTSTKLTLQVILIAVASVLAGWLAARSDRHDPPRHHLLALGGIVLFAVVVVVGSLVVAADEHRGGSGPPVLPLIAAPAASLVGGGAGVALHDARSRRD